MANLNQIELQNLRHLIGLQDTNFQKLTNYANTCADPQIKQLFTKATGGIRYGLQTIRSLFSTDPCRT